MRNNQLLCTVSILLFVISVLGTSTLRSGTQPFMFFAGIFMSPYLYFGGKIFKEVFESIRGRGLSLSLMEPKLAPRWFVLFGAVTIMFIGFLAWVSSCVGSTGLWYGLGIVIGTLSFRYGLGKVCEEYLQKFRIAKI